ncbi:MAG: hypothetical protein ACREQL_13475, partial [Candidatus Binatia bacterium]
LMNLRLAEPALGERYARAQALYNGTVHDWREPAYRHLLVIDLEGRSDWCAAVRALAPGALETRDAAADARSAAALTAILDLALAVRSDDDGAAPSDDSGASSALRLAAPPSDGSRTSSFDGIEAAPADRAAPLSDGERARLHDLERFAERVRSHPVVRLYGRIRRLWRGLGRSAPP